MPKTFFIVIALVIIIAAGYGIYQLKTSIETGGNEIAFDPLNATYTIGTESFTLINGKAEKEVVPESASKIQLSVWGEPVTGDFNSDQKTDAALFLTYSAGGSGTFYYVAASLQNPQTGQAIGTNLILLGDRIAPQNISINEGTIIVNYADRKSDEPMVASPSIGITRSFTIEGSELKEITPEWAKREQVCMISGGTIGTSLCCKSTEDFPNSCLIGACGCSSDNSHEVKVCDCGEGKCFDGTGCKTIE